VAIAFRSAATGTVDTGTDVVVDKPAGLADGDVLVAFWAQASDVSFTAPSGFVLAEAITLNDGLYQNVYTKVIGDASGEPSTYTFTLGGSRDHAVCLLAYSGVDGTTPVDVDGAQYTATDTTITAPSVTTTSPQGRLVRSFAVREPTTVSTPASTTSRAAVQSVSGVVVAMRVVEETYASTGATGTRAATAGTSGYNVGYTVALITAATAATVATVDAYTGAAFEAKPLKRYDGAAWAEVEDAAFKRYDGAAWVQA